MPKHLTGPAAAAALGLDGFRDCVFDPLFAVPHTQRGGSGRIRTRNLGDPLQISDLLVVDPSILVRHLAFGLSPLPRWSGDAHPISVADRIELACEDLLRRGYELQAPGSGMDTPGDQLVRTILLRRNGEPPTESYAETRFVQFARTNDLPTPWRQIPISAGDSRRRADFLVPHGSAVRRNPARPSDGLLIEIDSREFHQVEAAFARDRERRNLYSVLGFRLLELLPSKFEREPLSVARQIRSLLTTRWPRASAAGPKLSGP